MTGPEHYRYAQVLLDEAGDAELGSEHERYLVAKAQVHATLAVAAAQAAVAMESYIELDETAAAWAVALR